ncbi:MAG TPA: adenylate/guanylate cyclase domain-containing protein [Bryobacteraceae bacterium]|nr:adenylate/guanylate cyclase domain-containing protein [Bryobacteraceae bacterium]
MGACSLLIKEPDGKKRVVPIERPTLSLGRAQDNDVVLTDSELRVSRRHAVIEWDAERGATLRDERAVNGTFVNKQKVTAPVALHGGDVISIGPHEIVFREEKSGGLAWNIEPGAVDLGALQNAQKPQEPAGASQREPEAKAPEAPRLKALELLNEVGLKLAGTHTPSEVMKEAIQLLFRIEGVQRATLWPWDEKERCFHQMPMETRAGYDQLSAPMFDPQNVVLSSTILNRVRQENRPLLIRDIKSSEFSLSKSIVRAGIQAAFCSPVTSQGHMLGVLYADNLMRSDAFSQEDFQTFTIIAAQAGMALANSLAREEISRQDVERANLSRYLPPQVVDLITSKGGSMELGGVLQPVTVLFADIRGFTPLSEQMDAREVVDLLNDFFAVMTAAIFQSNGTLDKFIGDCVMALFGAPIPSDRSPRNALVAAVRMQQQVARLGAERLERGLAPLRIGIGLHHGPAVVGNIGSDERMQYTAIGDTVNIAARLVSRAEPGQILISETMHTAAGGGDLFHDLGLISVKGRDAQVRVYSVDWEKIVQRAPAA